jgi:hypothetical protein
MREGERLRPSRRSLHCNKSRGRLRHCTVTNIGKRQKKSQFCLKAKGWRKLHCDKIQCHIGRLECSNTAPESAGAREGWKIHNWVKAENAPSGIESLTQACLLEWRAKFIFLYTLLCIITDCYMYVGYIKSTEMNKPDHTLSENIEVKLKNKPNRGTNWYFNITTKDG